jgi:hypothetical protein
MHDEVAYIQPEEANSCRLQASQSYPQPQLSRDRPFWPSSTHNKHGPNTQCAIIVSHDITAAPEG